jgi:hypothetical protein
VAAARQSVAGVLRASGRPFRRRKWGRRPPRW